LLGTYNPKSKALTLDEARVKAWIAKGAQPTGSIHNLLVSKGIIEGKKINVLPKKTSQKKEDAPAAPASASAAEAVSAPTEAEIAAETAAAAEESPAEVPAAEEAPEETPAA
jgi:Ribosomal protein S16